MERSVDVLSVDYGLALQLATYSPRLLNEFRFQYAYVRRPSGVGGSRNEFSGTGPSVVINGPAEKANFGSPDVADSVFPPRKITQVQDNVTRPTGMRVFKRAPDLAFMTTRSVRQFSPDIHFRRSPHMWLHARGGTHMDMRASFKPSGTPRSGIRQLSGMRSSRTIGRSHLD